MNQKAFTLIELLAVISILAIIALITYPVVASVINDSKKKACEQQIQVIEDAAKRWYNDSVATNPNFVISNLTVEKLHEEGYIKTYPIYNPMHKNETISGTINYNQQQNQYIFTLENRENICN